MIKKWHRRVAELKAHWKEFRSDFAETVMEVTGDDTLAQVLGVAFITACYLLLMFVVYAVASLVLAFPVWGLWNFVAPDLGLSRLGYWGSYALTLLFTILVKGYSLHLHLEEGGKIS